MINLMYIVLTAMLALNVSSDVLNGFTQVEAGMVRTNSTLTARNQALLEQLKAFNEQNPEKGGVWYGKAVELCGETNSLYNFVDSLKLAIVRSADGADATLDNIKGQDNLEAASYVMLAPGTGKGERLRLSIDSFRDYVSQILTDSIKRDIISKTLTTEVKATPGNISLKSWEETMFENMPVVAAVTLLSKIQSDIRYAEGEALGALITNIDAGDVRVNEMNAFVIPSSRNVMRGSRYTANIIMAAALSKGETVIYNAACEPYLQQLCRMLTSMGVEIRGVGSNLVTVVGCDELRGTRHRILPDMIEVGSFIGLTAMTQSSLTIRNVSIDNLGIIPHSFRRLGIDVQQQGDDLYIPEQDTYEIESGLDGSIPTIADAPWPGLTPDLLSVILVAATQCRGSLLIHQKMFESRLFFVDRLIDMGAQIILCDPHRAVVIGLDHRYQLRAHSMSSPDIRAGIALLIAAMSAKGTSVIGNIEQIQRGYEDIDMRLNALGASIAIQ